MNNKKQFNKLDALKFTHFSRKGYALFSVLGREVLVGVLAVSTLTYAKAEGVSTETAYSLDSLSREEVKLDEVIVTGSRAPLTDLQTAKIVTVVTRDDIARAAAESINDVLKLVPGVDVRQRGGFGVQTDISVRGGNFDQITILLNGVNISSPHTGHLSADFPISPDDIERIEVLEGGYENGLCGVVNIVTTPNPTPFFCPNERSGKAERPARGKGVNSLINLYGGSYGYAGGNGRISYHSPLGSRGPQHWGAVSGGYTRSDGATPNSAFTSSKVFYNGGIKLGKVDLSAQVGYSYKPYEANTFYGASSTDQWESNERIIASLKASQTFYKNFSPRGGWEGGVYSNHWFDHYQWHRNNPAGENFHMVETYGANANYWFGSKWGKTSLGADWRFETINSSKLGHLLEEADWKPSKGHDAQKDILYKYHDSRTLFDLHAAHDILLRQWTVSLALTANYTALSKWSVLPAVNIAYRPADNWKIFASWSTALRQPTFTDLYYSGANIEGNSNLQPEKTSDFQLGVRKTGVGYSAELITFYSHKSNMIDWVTTPLPTLTEGEETDGIFRSVNFQMNNWGGEVNLTMLPQEIWGKKMPLRKVGLRYAYINEDSKYDVIVVQSKYAMEYLRHKVVLNADMHLWSNLNLGINWRWQDRIGENNPSYALLDARLSWDAKHWSVYVNGTNILNKEYYDFSTIRQPGIVVIGGVKIKL